MEIDQQPIEQPIKEEDASSNIRSEAIYIRGVDDLSSRDIKKYLDYYLKDSVISVDQRINTFKIEWINDSSICVVFVDADAVNKVFTMLGNDYDAISSLEATDERLAKTFYYNEQQTKPESSNEVKFYFRQAFKTDVKETNSKEKSRYYLLHGEPDRYERPRRGRNNNRKSRRDYHDENYRSRDRYTPENGNEPDLFADTLPAFAKEKTKADEDLMDEDLVGNSGNRWKSDKFEETNNAKRNLDDEEDLFPDFKPKNEEPSRSRSRSRSPGLSSKIGSSLKDRIGKGGKSRAHDLFA